MTIDEITTFLECLSDVATVRPGPGDGSPEVAWGDLFFHHAPAGVVPGTGQPFATIVTKDYPGDDRSRLSRPGRFRLNIGVDRADFERWTGHPPRDTAARGADPAVTDTLVAHPVYGTASWLAVVNPGPRTDAAVRELLRAAHSRAVARHARHHG